jgi:tetratricopeptide (TPR) repeat protein
LLTALLFVIHPLQTQAVTYIVQRSTSLAALFYVTSMVGYLNSRLSTDTSRSLGWAAMTGVLALLAFFTKQNTATLPLAWLLMEAAFFKDNRKRLVVGAAVLVLGVSAAYVGTATVLEVDPFSLESMISLTQETETISRSQYLSTQGRVLLTYLRLFCWPTGLHLDWDYPLSEGFSNASTLAVALMHVGVIALAILLLRRYSLAAFGVCFFYLAHSVESSVIPIRDVIFEHRTYLPNLGLCLLVSLLAFAAIERWSRRRIVPLATAVLVALGVATWTRNSLWNDKIAFWENNVARTPNKARPHLNLGRAYDQAGEHELAIRAFERAIELQPRYARAHSNLGAVYAKNNDRQKAIRHLQKAIEIEPTYATAHNNLGTLFALSGRLDLAADAYQKALSLEPQYARARERLAEIHVRQGSFAEAEHELRQALLSSPNSADALFLLGVCLQSQDRFDEAVDCYERALRLDPRNLSAVFNLGFVFTRQGRTDEAVAALSKVLRHDPKSATAHFLLGLNLAQLERFEEAAASFRTCLQLDPTHEDARKHLELAEGATHRGR